MRKVTPHHLQTKRRKDSVFFLPCCVIKAHENTNRRKGYSSHIFSFFFPRVNVKSFSTGRTGRGQFGYMITIVVPFATLRQIFRNRGELFLHRFLPDFPRTFFFSKSLPSNRKRFAPQRASVYVREKRREQRRSSFFGHELSCLLTIHYLRCSFFLRFFFRRHF